VHGIQLQDCRFRGLSGGIFHVVKQNKEKDFEPLFIISLVGGNILFFLVQIS
jgi:hypothetical protein